MKIQFYIYILYTGADLGFSRGRRGGGGGGGVRGFYKKFSKFCRPFFQVDQIDFSNSPKTLKRPCFGKIFAPQAKF